MQDSSVSTTQPADLAPVTRRGLIGFGGKAVLSATAIAMLAGCESMSKEEGGAAKAAMADPSGDVDILNVALALEHEAIGAYQLGAESGLLPKDALDVAVLFQSQHKDHRDALIATITQLGGTPVAPKSLSEYATDLNAASLQNATDILELAAKHELGAANAYLSVIPAFSSGDLAQVSGRLAADEVMHWTILNNALGKPVPKNALSFGA